MPLTEERRHVFRVRKSWFISDPFRDADELRAEWRLNFAVRVEPVWKPVLRWVVGLSTFGVLALALGVAATSLGSSPFTALGWLIALIGTFLGIFGAAALTAKVLPTPPIRRRRIEGVIELDDSVVVWADGATAIETLRELGLRVDRMRQIETARLHWSFASWDWEQGDPPEELIADLIRPALMSQRETEARLLASLAERHAFDVPRELRVESE